MFAKKKQDSGDDDEDGSEDGSEDDANDDDEVGLGVLVGVV